MHLRRLPFFIGAVLASLLSVGRAQPASFALLPPSANAALKAEADSAEGNAILRWAKAAMAREAHPLPVVHTEGILPHTGIHDVSSDSKKDWSAMLDLALAYRMTGDAGYLQADERYFSEWLRVYRLSFSPIDETDLDQMIVANDAAGSELSAPTRQNMGRFLRAMAEGYLAKISREKTEDVANWQSHRIKLIVLAAYSIGDPGLIERARKAFYRQVSVNIRRDGSVVDFGKRDALHYVVYDLEPLTVAALAAKAHGEDWFHSAKSGAPSVASAIDWLTPYALGEKTHQEFVHSSVKFDSMRAQAGLKEYGPELWKPASSAYLYQLAAFADSAYQPTFEHVIQSAHGKPQLWFTLVSRALKAG